ncbi:uncharacterized protein [Amphiura filiformis]|uniref:uncharacterized protein n=1 Tax=Amphiura filiformis TaxID=82378 RepID=UPI003B228314
MLAYQAKKKSRLHQQHTTRNEAIPSWSHNHHHHQHHNHLNYDERPLPTLAIAKSYEIPHSQPSRKETEAATRIQAAWKGYRARHYNSKVINARNNIRSQRVEKHIKYLNKELDRTRQMYEQEKHLRTLQMEALKLLWNQVRTLHEWKQDVEDKDLLSPQRQAETRTVSTSPIDTHKSFEFPVQSEEKIETLQSQVSKMQGSLDHLTSLITSGILSANTSPMSLSSLSSPSAGHSPSTSPQSKKNGRPSSPTKSRSPQTSPRLSNMTSPKNLSIHVRSDTSISLSWQPSRLLNEKSEPLSTPVKLYRLSITVGGRQREMMEVPHTQAILGGLTPGLYKFFVRGANKQGESPASNIVKIRLPRPGGQTKRKGSDGETEAVAKETKHEDDSETLSQSASESLPETIHDVDGAADKVETPDVLSSAEEELEGAAAKDVAREMSVKIVEAAIENALDSVESKANLEQMNNSKSNLDSTQDSDKKSAMTPSSENSESSPTIPEAVSGEEHVCSEPSGTGAVCDVAVLPVGSSCGDGIDDGVINNDDNVDNNDVQGVPCASDNVSPPLQLPGNDNDEETDDDGAPSNETKLLNKTFSVDDDTNKAASEEEAGWTFLSKPSDLTKDSDSDTEPQRSQSAPATPMPFTTADGARQDNPFEGADDILKDLTTAEKQEQPTAQQPAVQQPIAKSLTPPGSPKLKERYPSLVQGEGAKKESGASPPAAAATATATQKVAPEQPIKKPIVEKQSTKSKPRIGKLAANFFGKSSHKASKQSQKAEDTKSSRKQLRDAPYSRDTKSKKNKDKLSSKQGLAKTKGKSASLDKGNNLKSFSSSTDSAPGGTRERSQSIGPIEEKSWNRLKHRNLRRLSKLQALKEMNHLNPVLNRSRREVKRLVSFTQMLTQI